MAYDGTKKKRWPTWVKDEDLHMTKCACVHTYSYQYKEYLWWLHYLFALENDHFSYLKQCLSSLIRSISSMIMMSCLLNDGSLSGGMTNISEGLGLESMSLPYNVSFH